MDQKYNTTTGGVAGKVQTRLQEYGEIRFPVVVGQFNEISREFHDLIKFSAEDIAKKRFETTTLPIDAHAELIGPIVWYLKQLVGMHLFRTHVAYNFLHLCLGFANSACHART